MSKNREQISFEHHWVELIMIEPFAGGYSPVAPGFWAAATNGSTETAEDIERRTLSIAIEFMERERPDLYRTYAMWRMTKDRTTMGEVFIWLETMIDHILAAESV